MLLENALKSRIFANSFYCRSGVWVGFCKNRPSIYAGSKQIPLFLATDWQHFCNIPWIKLYFYNIKTLLMNCFPNWKEQSVRFFSFCSSNEPKSKLAWDLGDRLQFQNVPLGTSDDCISLLILFFQSLDEFVREFLRRNFCPNFRGVQCTGTRTGENVSEDSDECAEYGKTGNAEKEYSWTVGGEENSGTVA